MISKITYLFTVAITYMFIGKLAHKLHTRKLKDTSLDALLLASLVIRANNRALIRHVLPVIVTSTNNTIVLVLRRAMGSDPNYSPYLSSPESRADHNSVTHLS